MTKPQYAEFSLPEAVGYVRDPVLDSAAPISQSTDAWLEPQPLLTKTESEPYPLDALPKTIRDAVEEVFGFTKAPLAMVATSALSALSLAGQGLVDVKRAEKLTGATGVFTLIIADSGERKSTCDGYFIKPIKEYEREQAEAAKSPLRDYTAKMEAWEAKGAGIKNKIKQLAQQQKSTADMEEALRNLEHSKPEAPRIPRLIYADATPEALAYGLAKNWPSGGVVSAEAGTVFGSHGMGSDSIMRNLALLNQLWDGADLTVDRRTSESFSVRGGRLTIGLQVQEATLRSFFERSGGLARGTGFFARFLLAWPESTQGFRPFSDAPVAWPALAHYHRRIAALLATPVPMREDGGLNPALLAMTPEAKKLWVVFHDTIESQLCKDGELYDVRDVAAKTADNAARLAALFHVLDYNASGSIAASTFESAGQIAAWHLNESLRFFGEMALPENLTSAITLQDWLLTYCQKNNTTIIPRRNVQQNITPVYLRKKDKLENALDELIDTNRLREIIDGKRKSLQINPALLVKEGA